MKKTLPIIAIVSSALVIGAGAFALANNKIGVLQASAKQYSLEFTSASVDSSLIDYSGCSEYYKYVSYYMSVETELGNTFETDYSVTFPYIGCDTSATVKTNNHIFEMTDSGGEGYFAINFKFNLSIATFDHITIHGNFNYGYSHTSTTFITFSEVESSGMITVGLEQIWTATLTSIDVVYVC